MGAPLLTFSTPGVSVTRALALCPSDACFRRSVPPAPPVTTTPPSMEPAPTIDHRLSCSPAEVWQQGCDHGGRCFAIETSNGRTLACKWVHRTWCSTRLQVSTPYLMFHSPASEYTVPGVPLACKWVHRTWCFTRLQVSTPYLMFHSPASEYTVPDVRRLAGRLLVRGCVHETVQDTDSGDVNGTIAQTYR